LLVDSSGPFSPFTACPPLSLPKPAALSQSSSSSYIFFGVALPTTASQALLAWIIIFSVLLCLAMVIALTRAANEVTGLLSLPLVALKFIDIFSMSHQVKDDTSPIKRATPLGGLFTLMGLSTLLTYASYMVASWRQDNTLVQKSLAILGPQVWSEVATLPWVTSSSSAGPLSLRLTIDGNPGAMEGGPGACSSPTKIFPTLEKGAFKLQSTSVCSQSGSAQHTITCPGCRLSGQIALSLVFDYSCQSMHLEAQAISPSFPEATTTSTLSLPPSRTAAAKSGAGLLTSLTWELTPVLSVLWDNVTSTGSAMGWSLGDSKLTVGSPFNPPAQNNGSLTLLPLSSSVTVNFVLSVSSTYSSTLLTQRVPITQLLANLVGLSGMLAFFGVAFGNFEVYCTRGKHGGKRQPLSHDRSNVEGQLRKQTEAESLLARVAALETRLGATPSVPAETPSSTARGASPIEIEGGKFSVGNPLVVVPSAAPQQLQQQSNPPLACAPLVWKRHHDETDEWFECLETGKIEWRAPQGATIVE